MAYTKILYATAKRNLDVMRQRVKEKKGVPWQVTAFGPLGAFLVDLKPQDPQKGPPLPQGMDIKWPEKILTKLLK